VVSGGLLEIDAVRRGLLDDLVFDDGPADCEPAASRTGAPEKTAEEDQPDAVAQVVVAVEIGLLEVLDDELAVEEQGAQEPAPEPRVTTRAGSREEMKSPDPADGSQRDVHRAGPVHAVRQRVRSNPVCRLGGELRRVPLVAREPVRLAETGEMLATAELPRHLDVGRPIELVVFDVGAIGERPPATGLEVGVPRQRRAEGLRAGPQQIEFVAQYRVGGLRDPGGAAGELGLEPVGDSRAILWKDEERLCRQVVPEAIDAARAERREQRAVGEDPRIDVRPRPPGTALRRVHRPPDEIPGRAPERAAEARRNRTVWRHAPRRQSERSLSCTMYLTR